MRFRFAIPAAVFLIAAAAVTSGCNNSSSASSGPKQTTSSASHAPATGPVSVTLSEFKVATSATSAKGPKVTFDVRNAGKLPHEFVVLRTSKPSTRLGSGPRIKEAGHVGETGEVKPGATKKLTLRLKPGHYSLVCNLPGHYMGGMHTDFTVQ